ncbi:MAG TPA: hypothetical protein VIU93_00635 [Gallionellaceae bacterium]
MAEATLRDALESAIDAADVTSNEPQGETTATTETFEASESQESARQRDERGRFARKEEEAAKAEQAASGLEPQPQVETPRRESPKSWKKELAEKYWNNIDPELQEEILRREEAVSQGFERYKGDSQYASELRSVLEPYGEYFNQLGVTPTHALSHLMNTEYRLRNGSPYEKTQMFHELARSYGVDLGQVAQQPHDPSFQLMNRLQQLESQLTNYQGYQQQAQEERLRGEIESFASTHEHLDAVRDDMALLLQAGKAQDLQSAYDVAIRMNPELFNTIQERERQANEAKRREDADRAAKAAKAAAVSVRGSPAGATATQVPPGSLRDALERAVDGRI